MSRKYRSRKLENEPRSRQLAKDLEQAIQKQRLNPFIDRLEASLESGQGGYRSWLFLSRAYIAKGDIESASATLIRLLETVNTESLGRQSKEYILGEIRELVVTYKAIELIQVAEQKFGATHFKSKPLAQIKKKSEEGFDAQNQSLQREQLARKNWFQSIIRSLRRVLSRLLANLGILPSQQPPQTLEKSLNSQLKVTLSSEEDRAFTREDDEGQELSEQVISQLVRDAWALFNEGQLEAALENFIKAYELGDRRKGIFNGLTQTLQRLKRFDEAQQYLDEGIKLLPRNQHSSLLNFKAQILSSQQHWDQAAAAYEQYINFEKTPGAVRAAKLHLVQIYAFRLNQAAKGQEILDQVLKESPQNQFALNLKTALEQSLSTDTAESQTAFNREVPEPDLYDLEIEGLPDQGVDFISPMLERDLATAMFRDKSILLGGGKPETSDADRLLQQAEADRDSEFGDRYPRFLEAAKAYNELPEGSYKISSFLKALAQYAVHRGSAFVFNFRGQLSLKQRDVEKLKYLRDSATSYYLESLALQGKSYVLIPLTNHLKVQVAYFLATQGESLPTDFFESQVRLMDVFDLCFNDEDENLTRIACETVVAWGAANWNQLQRVKHGPKYIMHTLLQRQETRRQVYQKLSEISGESFNIHREPKDVLKAVFSARRHQKQEIREFFERIEKKMPFRIQNFQEIHRSWNDDFPYHRGALLETDVEIHQRINDTVLADLSPYLSRSPEEKSGIISRVRMSIESLLRFIQDSPTYWGRVGFEPILSRWRSSVLNIEQQRLREIQPKLVVQLEPPLFHLEDSFITGGLLLRNTGRGTAEGASICIKLIKSGSGEVNELLPKQTITQEIPVNQAHDYPIKFQHSDLVPSVGDSLCVEVAPIFRQEELEVEVSHFTLEIDSGTRISEYDIPWDEARIPPSEMFKGRERLIQSLLTHLSSRERSKTYFLYGLTRTGKSSILNYLAKELDLKPIRIHNSDYRFISFEWNFVNASNQSDARDMWHYFLVEGIIDKLQKLAEAGNSVTVPNISYPQRIRFKDWERLINDLHAQRLYPVFLIDEFAYYRELVNKKTIDSSFLAAIRGFALQDKGSFIFAGTYDIRRLIRDEAYGITGQLVNVIDKKVSAIERQPAIELIKAMGTKLRFTDDAVNHILSLSYQIPYFIHIICKHCAIFAMDSGRTIIGYPEVERIVRRLTGEDPTTEDSITDEMPQDIGRIYRLPAGIFANNMDSPSDQDRVWFNAILSTICTCNRDQRQRREVPYQVIARMWHEGGVPNFRAKLAEGLQELSDREVLVEENDEGVPNYKISVDLFRRWWTVEHPYLDRELDTLKQGG